MCEALLHEALPQPTPDRELQVAKRLYVVHQGAIYEATSSDGGISYHGYPYRGKLSSNRIAELREMASRKGCLNEFEKWISNYIIIQGGVGLCG